MIEVAPETTSDPLLVEGFKLLYKRGRHDDKEREDEERALRTAGGERDRRVQIPEEGGSEGGWSFLEIITSYIVQGPVLCGDGNSECCKKREFWGRHEEQNGRRKIG